MPTPEEVKQKTDLCDTFSCYEDCERCIEQELERLAKKGG